MNDTHNHAAPHRTFSEAIKVCLSKCATFRGRASRSEYWWFMLFIVLVSIVAEAIDIYLLGNHDLSDLGNPALSDGTFVRLWAIAMMLPYCAAGARRLHDIGRSGWWILLAMPAGPAMSLPVKDEFINEFIINDVVIISALIIWLPLIIMQCFRGKPNLAT